MNPWVKGLLNTILTGIGTAGGSWIGMMGVKAGGFQVPELNFKAGLIIIAAGAATNVFSFLRTSPLYPNAQQETSVTVTKKDSAQ